MRVIDEINYPQFKLSIFYMNGKYILKFERGNLEQSYKISELDYIIKNVDDIKSTLTPAFLEKITQQFSTMELSMDEALKDF